MPLMRSPDGSETVEVPDSLVAHYSGLGAQLVGQPMAAPATAQGFTPDFASQQYAGGADMGLQDPGLLDPLNYVGVPGAVRNVARTAVMAGLRGAGRGIARTAGLRTLEQIPEAAAQQAPGMVGGVGTALGRIAGPIGKFIRKESPVGKIERGLELAKDLRAALTGEGAQTATSSAEKAAVEAAPAQGKHLVQGYERSNPIRKPIRPPKSAAAKAATKAPEPGTAASRLTVVEGKGPAPTRFAVKNPKTGKFEIVEGKAPSAAAKPAPKAAPAGPRHEVQYFSESQGKYVDIEKLNQKHLESAYRKLAAKEPKPGSVGRKVLDALETEAKHRMTATGIHIGQ